MTSEFAPVEIIELKIFEWGESAAGLYRLVLAYKHLSRAIMKSGPGGKHNNATAVTDRRT